MTISTASERALLDTHPQQTDLYLSIYEPSVAVACRVTGSYDHNNQSVATYDVTDGALSNITEWLYNVTLVGTSAGSDDKGRTWTRYASGTSIRFLESDHINWANGDYLTVLKFTEIIPVFPRIIQNPAQEDDVIFYKVWDVPYTNQNSILGSFINMGCNHAEFRDVATGLASVYWSASGTANLLSDALTYLWEFEGGTPTGSTSATPGWVTYDTPAHYRTILRVTSASGREDISARYVSVYDRPGHGSNVPILNWEIVELSGSRDSVGTKGRLRVRTDVSKPEIRDGALVVIFKDDWYGATKQSVGGNASNRSSIHFWGYIQDGTIQYNYQDGFVEFEVMSPAHIMEISECFSCSVESKASPSKWYELLNMTVGRAIYHYLAWQSSVLQCCDVSFPRMADDDRNIQYFDADRTSLYEAVNGVVSGALKGRIVCDRQGKLYIEKEFSVLDSPTTKLPIAMDISKKDWIGQLTVTEQVFSPTAFIEMGGIAYSGSTGTFGAFLASAPGSAPRYQGSVERIQGLALNNQADLNTMVGHLLANMNARYPRIEMVMRGNLANLDIAPQELVRLTVLPEDTPRGITFTLKEFALRSVDWSWNAKDKLLVPRIGISEVTQGFAGTTITIPNVPPTEGDDGSGGGSYTVPPVVVPPLPPPIYYPTGTAYNLEPILYLNAGWNLGTDDWIDPDTFLNWEWRLIDTHGFINFGSSRSKINITIPGTYLLLANFRVSNTGAAHVENINGQALFHAADDSVLLDYGGANPSEIGAGSPTLASTSFSVVFSTSPINFDKSIDHFHCRIIISAATSLYAELTLFRISTNPSLCNWST